MEKHTRSFPALFPFQGYARKMSALALVGGLFALFIATAARAEEFTLAVASNFATPMQAIAAKFEARTGHKVNLASGSSGKLFAQIRHGAPFDAFFSADQVKPSRLVALDLAKGSTLFTYANGTLVLWSSHADLVDGQGSVLNTGRYKKLAIANPRLAPYGIAAVEALQSLGIEQSSRARRVQGENISQTYQFVATGNADLGLVALSQLMRNGRLSKGSAWIVPQSLYRPIRQDAVILNRGVDSPALAEFWAFFSGPEVQEILASFGYTADFSPEKAEKSHVE